MSGQFNVFRKAFHFSGIIYVLIYFTDYLHNLPGGYFLENTRSVLFYALTGVYLIMVIYEILRFRYPFFQNLFVAIAGKILKPDELHKTHGSMPFFLGLAVCTAFCLKEIAILGALFLMIGDPCAAWFGGKYGKHKLANGKSYEGFAAGILGAFLIGVLFLIINNQVYPENIFSRKLTSQTWLVLFLLLLSALAAFSAELLSSSGFFDDNFLIPVVSGTALSFLFAFFFNLDFTFVFFPVSDLLIPIT